MASDRVHVVNGGRISDPSRNGQGPDISLEKGAEEVDIVLWTVTWYVLLTIISSGEPGDSRGPLATRRHYSEPPPRDRYRLPDFWA